MSFQEILSKPMAEIKPPKPLPVGTYTCIVDGVPEIKQVGKEQNWAAILKLKPVAPGPDVDQVALVEALDGKALTEVSIQNTLWLTEKAAFRAKQFIENCGIDITTKSLGEGINELPGKQIMVTLSHRPSEDGKTMYNEIKSTAAV